MDGPYAIGTTAEGAWVGFVRLPSGYRLAVDTPDGVRSEPADENLLLALAIAYFEDALDDPPPELEATQADVSGLVRDVAARSLADERGRLLAEAIDAIDDGLAVDAVVNRLTAALGPRAKEQADPVDLLLERVRALREG